MKQTKRELPANDPNAWFDEPRDLVAAMERMIHVGIGTVASKTTAMRPALCVF